ncbi:MAG: nucleotide exchange factor GrpE [Methanobacteriota archaeon]
MDDSATTREDATKREAAPEADEPVRDLSSLETELARLRSESDEQRKKAEEYLDRLQRLGADFDNYKKRVAKERESATERAKEGLLVDLIDIMENLDRALESGSGTDDALYQGITLILRQFHGLLEREGLRRIDAEGHPFDPKLHEAVMREETTSYADGVIIKELQKGYFFKDRVLRPAKVKVATRAPPMP